ncbi:HAD family hydrolase [Nonomuraea sp. NPDC050556]|uniref:HAD family hydrolase n=1 Tax=Nonomuraea sp. NPDC050556 TaxID=3364369 RepID=UPI0037BB5384
MAYKAVIFDFFGTLTVSVPAAHRVTAVGELAAAIGAPADAFREAWWGSWSQRSVGEMGAFPEALRTVAQSLDVTPSHEQVGQAVQIRQANERRFMRLREDTLTTLEALQKRGLVVGLISDCTDDLPEEWPGCPAAPYIDSPVFSYVAGVKKPDPRIYALACQSLGVQPEDCLYVGDGGSDELAGATKAGMTALKIQDQGENHRFDSGVWTGAEIEQLGDLLDGGRLGG